MLLRISLTLLIALLGTVALVIGIGRALTRGDQLLLQQQTSAGTLYLALADVERMLIVQLTVNTYKCWLAKLFA